jgi:hypothetical protein
MKRSLFTMYDFEQIKLAQQKNKERESEKKRALVKKLSHSNRGEWKDGDPWPFGGEISK